MESRMINRLFVVLLACMVPFSAWGSDEMSELEGTFGLSNINESTALAFWVPLGSGETISGVEWFNSDCEVVFPEFLAVAGEAGHPELLADATLVAQLVTGGSLQWCEFSFLQPLSTTADGLYLIWKLPAGSEYTGPGTAGGAGFGILAGGEENHCWVTNDGQQWEALTVSHQIAMMAVMGYDKSGNELVLSKPGTSHPVLGPAKPMIDEKITNYLTASPNPFNPATTIKFHLPVAGLADVSVYDVRGRLVRNLLYRSISKGEHEIFWDGRSTSGQLVASGHYIVQVISGKKHDSIGITLTK